LSCLVYAPHGCCSPLPLDAFPTRRSSDLDPGSPETGAPGGTCRPGAPPRRGPGGGAPRPRRPRRPAPPEDPPARPAPVARYRPGPSRPRPPASDALGPWRLPPPSAGCHPAGNGFAPLARDSWKAVSGRVSNRMATAEVATVHWERLVVGPIEANCYLLYDRPGGEAMVIDPGADGHRILEALTAKELQVKAILLTHTHFDHIGALEPVHQATGAPILVHEAEAGWLGDPTLNLSAGLEGLLSEPIRGPHPHRTLVGGEVLTLAGQAIRVLPTPGHTPGG